VIDELADLMMVDTTTWKSPSRAGTDGARGGHPLILADAAASVDVITV